MQSSSFPKRTCFARGRLSRRAVEIVLGLSLMAFYRRKAYVGIIAALFFVAVFPGNIAQYTEHRAAFGLETDTARLVPAFLLPAFVACALLSTRSWTSLPLSPGRHECFPSAPTGP